MLRSAIVASACLSLVACSLLVSDDGYAGNPSIAANGNASSSSGGMNGSTPGTDAGDTDSGPSTPEPIPETDPNAGATSFAWDEGAEKSAAFGPAARSLLSTCTDGVKALSTLEAPPSFIDEGKSSSDPARMKSAAIWTALDDVMPRLGYCARLVNPAQSQARAAIIEYVKRLAAVYVGGLNTNAAADDDDPGNPINEWHLLSVAFAIDMIHAKLTGADLAVADDLLTKAENRVAQFMNALTSTDLRRKNNWAARALTLRAAGALARADSAKAQNVAAALNQHAADVYVAPAGFTLSSCANLASVGAFGSADLQRSDSLNAHVQPLQQLVRLVALRKGYVSANAEKAFGAALEVLAPYASKQKTHEEYVCTTSSTEKANHDAGVPGFSGPWDPEQGRLAFRFGRIAYPTTRTWSGAFTTAGPTGWIDVFVTGKGDVIAP